MSAIVILSWIDFEPGDRDIYLARGNELMDATRHEVGCIRHVMAPDPHSPTAVIAHAHYSDQAAFDAHLRGEHFARFLSQVEGCRVRERKTDRFDATKIN